MLNRTRVLPMMHWKSSQARRQLGFTLIELIIVIILLGIVAIFVSPRILSSDAFDARGFSDETLALLRYAQKAAIAQRRTVCIAFTNDSAVLSIASAAGSPNCDTALRGPKGDSPRAVTARAGTAFSITPANLNFDGLGQAVDRAGTLSGTQTIQVRNAAHSITVEAVTGYVHE